MNSDELKHLIEDLCGLWPGRATPTEQQQAMLGGALAKFDYETAWGAACAYAQAASYPKWPELIKQIREAHHGREKANGWGMGLESELSNWIGTIETYRGMVASGKVARKAQRDYREPMDQAVFDEYPPTCEWIIRQLMHREPPPESVRAQAREAIRKNYERLGIDGTHGSVEWLKQQHIDQCAKTKRAADNGVKLKTREDERLEKQTPSEISRVKPIGTLFK